MSRCGCGWGTAEWEALATGVAALVALALGVQGVWRDRGARVDAEAHRRESLARAVDVWSENALEGAYIYIRNGGSRPITKVLLPTPGRPAQAILAEGHEPHEEEVPQMLGTVMPFRVKRCLFGPVSLLPSVFTIEFTDANGVRWIRTSDGHLREPYPPVRDSSWLRRLRARRSPR